MEGQELHSANNGCLTCRGRQKVGCDNGLPKCNNCISGGFACEAASPSFLANIASSASGLLRHALAPTGNQAGDTLSQALYQGGKAGASAGVSASAPSATYQPTPRPEFVVATGVSPATKTFRSSTRPSNALREAFEGTTIDQFLQSEPESRGYLVEQGQQLFKGKKAVYNPENWDVSHPSYDPYLDSAWHYGDVEKHTQGREINDVNDGGEVLKLLLDPSLQPEMWTEDEPAEPYTITNEEMQIARWFTQKIQEGETTREQLQRAVTAARSGQAFKDFASIFDELESYHEDVWGYIGPFVEAARQEQRVAEPTSTGDGPAVHRLRMIVAHLQAAAPPNSNGYLS